MKNQKLIIILLVAILAVLLIPYLLLGAVFSSNMSTMNNYTPPAQTARPKVSAEDVAAMIVNNCKMMFGDSFASDLDQDAGFYTVRIWDENIDADMIARTAEGENRDSWESMVYSYTETANTMQKAFIDNGADDITVVLSICDPADQVTPFLTIANGIVGYDTVRGIDLRAGQN